MRLENVHVTVALERMWIYARDLPVWELELMQASLLNGHTITYVACDQDGNAIGRTRVKPEQVPVITVTETTF